MPAIGIEAHWKGDRLYLGNKLSGYTVVPDETYPTMWRVRGPDGSLSDMVNRTRAKDAALAALAREMRVARATTAKARP
jgi:hypothetical protein